MEDEKFILLSKCLREKISPGYETDVVHWRFHYPIIQGGFTLVCSYDEDGQSVSAWVGFMLDVEDKELSFVLGCERLNDCCHALYCHALLETERRVREALREAGFDSDAFREVVP